MNAVSFTHIGTVMKASKTKIAVALFLIVLGIVLFPGKKLNAAEEQSGNCGANGDNVTWTLDSDGTLTISGKGGIKERAFYTNKSIRKVVIEDGVTSLGEGAFMQCESLTSITIPNSVTSISDNTFVGCRSLTSITIPNSVTSIGICSFWACTSLTSITIPDSVTSIGIASFSDCTSLTSITIPNSVKSIGNGAFDGCTSLTSVTIPNSVTSLGNGAFEKCSRLRSIKINKKLYEKFKDIDAFYGVSPDAFDYYYNATYETSTVGGSISGNVKTYETDEITIKPDQHYSVDKVVLTVKDKNGNDVEKELSPANGKYLMPDYDFNNWTGDCKVTASFKLVEYEITFKNDDGTVLESKKVTYGETPSYTGTTTPTKESDGQYEYTFSGWSPEITTVTGDATYFAIYDKKEIKYKVAFVDIDGNEICSDDVGYLEVPVFNGKTPTKPESATSTFVFAGWNDGKTTYQLTESLPQTKADTTFKPMFKEVKKPVYTVGEVKGDGINSDIVIDVHRDSDDENCLTYFSKATIDGTEMTIGDQYTATKGSTIITIKKDFLSTLSSGEHEVTVNFNDGSITAKVTIAAKTKTNTSVPSTGEVTGPAAYIGLTFVAAACACGAGIVLLKKRKEA